MKLTGDEQRTQIFYTERFVTDTERFIFRTK